MIDLAGPELSAQERARLTHRHVGGVILFTRNFRDRAQLATLVTAIRATRRELLIAVDHEGGRVQRFRAPGFTVLPPMRSLGLFWDSDAQQGAVEALRCAAAIGYVLARELIACGVDLSFAPVVDLDYGTSMVIGDRALHRDARVVTLLAASLTHGMLAAGMAHCAKHFPGHGKVAADSHVAAPIDERELDEILAEDAAPYRWLAPTLAAVMPAHVTYPRVAPEAAGFSPRWLGEILRERLGFTGAIFSDDLSMQGAASAGTVAEAAQRALAAGCDMVPVCNDESRVVELLETLDWRYSEASRGRIRALVRAPLPGTIDLARDPVYQANRAIVARFQARSNHVA